MIYKSSSSTDNLLSNLINNVNKCKSFEMMDLFVSGITFNKRLSYTVVERANEKIVDMCDKNGIDNGNISNMYLYQNSSHLLERYILILAKNCIFVLINFLNMHSRHHLIDIMHCYIILRKQI